MQCPLVSEWPRGRQRQRIPLAGKLVSCRGPSTFHEAHLAGFWVERNSFSKLFFPSLMEAHLRDVP